MCFLKTCYNYFSNKFRKPYYVDDLFLVIAEIIQVDENCSSRIFTEDNSVYQPLLLHSCNHSNCDHKELVSNLIRTARDAAYNPYNEFHCQIGTNRTDKNFYWFCYVKITRKLDSNDLIEAGPVSQHPLKHFSYYYLILDFW